MFKLFKITFMAFLVLCASRNSFAQTADTGLTRFYSEAPVAWQKLSTMLSKFQKIEIEETETVSGIRQAQPIEMKVTTRRSILLNRGNFVIITSQHAEDGDKIPDSLVEQFSAERLSAYNHRYWFSLRKSDSIWRLESVIDSPDLGSIPDVPEILGLIGSAISDGSLESFVDPALYEASDYELDSDGHVSITLFRDSSFYAEKPNTDGSTSNELIEKKYTAKVVFDPQFYWLPLRATITFAIAGQKHEGEYEWSYPDKLGGSAPIVSVKKSYQRPNGVALTDRRLSFIEEKLDNKQFYLSYYGLPEPSGDGFVNQYIAWGSAIAVLMVVSMFIFLRMKSKAK